MEYHFLEAKHFFYGFKNHYQDLKLENLTAFLEKLGNPQNSTKVIHIAGTNGKGSVSAYISNILIKAGYKIGRYNSPAVFSERENITINNIPMGEKEFARQVSGMGKQMVQADREGRLPTVFELETAMAYRYFAENQCDFAVVECGMGGRTDATNVTNATVLSILTSISYDHTAYLGSSLGEIAGCKAGIIKKNIPVISISQEKEAMEAIEREAKKKQAVLIVAEKEKITSRVGTLGTQAFVYKEQEYTLSMTGRYQAENACLAIEAAKELKRQGYDISEDRIVRGLRDTKLCGRFEAVCTQPLVIIDGAHNPDAAARLRENILDTLAGYYIIFIIGVFKDKEYQAVLEKTCDLAQEIYAVRADGERALEAETLAECIKSLDSCTEKAVFAMEIPDALERAFASAGQNGKTAVVCFGSLSYLKYIKESIKEWNLKEI